MDKLWLELKGNFRFVILFSLCITLVKTVFDIVMGAMVGGSPLFIALFMTALVATELVLLLKKDSRVWIVSAVHTLCVFAFSVGTFGYLITYLFRALAFGNEVFSHIMSGLLILSETGKTLYLYRERN